MSERLREKVSRQPEENRKWFEEEGVLEDLIREGRIPRFWDTGKVTFVFFPPEGAKAGDEYELIPGGEVEYFAPNGGPSRGRASLHEVTHEVGEELKIRKNKLLEELGLPTS